MYEKYHLTRYVFPVTMPTQIQETDLNEQAFEIFKNSEYRLHGFTDVLSTVPQTDAELKNYLYLQSFSYMHSPFDYFTKRTNVDSYLIIYTHEGSGCMEYEGNTYQLFPGDLVLIDCHLPHYYYTFRESWSHVDMHISGSTMPFLYQEFRLDNAPYIEAHQYSTFKEDTEKLLKCYTTPTLHRGLEISNILQSILTHMILTHQTELSKKSYITDSSLKYLHIANQERTYSSQNMPYLIKYMQNHQENLTLDYLSSFANISKYHLAREFKRYTGFPPNEYLLRIRLQQAKLLLKNTSSPIKIVGELVGIANESYFARLFKKRIGMTPGEYRKKEFLLNRITF